MPSNITDLGWKFFFGLLAFLQVAGIALAMRIADTVSTTAEDVRTVKQRQEEKVIPSIDDHEKRLDDIEKKK